jgi:uncharacterized protein involved in exopolysaccharide biosynthesis
MDSEFMHRSPEQGIPAQVLIYPQPVTPAAAATGLLLADLFAAIRARLLLVLGGSIAGAALAVLMSMHVRPVYEATAVYAPAMATGRAGLAASAGLSSGLVSLGQMAGISLQGPALGAVGALIESRDTTMTALKDENLLPLLFPSRWDRKKQAWHPVRVTWLMKLMGNVPQSPTGEPTPAEIARRILGIRTIELKALSNTVVVRIRMTDAEAAARFANRLAYYVNESERDRTRDETGRAIDYLRQQLGKETQVGLQESLGRVLQSELEAAAMADSRTDYLVRVVDPAIVPDHPITPKRSLYLLFGLLTGGFTMTIVAVSLYQKRRSAHGVVR